MRNLLAILLSFGVLQFSVAQDNRTMKDCPDGSAKSEKIEGEASYGEPFASIKENKQEKQLECEYGSADAQSKMQHKQHKEKGQTNIQKNEVEGEAKANDQEFEYKFEQDNDGSIERSYDFEGENIEIESDVEIDKDAELNPSMDNNSSFNNEQLGTQNQTSSIDNTNLAPVAYTEVAVVEERESTLENVIEAPFKAGITLVSETAEGVGHIVGAPFKAIGKLFGNDDDDDM